jgi:hypothetical protein
MNNITPTVKNLIIINVVMFLAGMLPDVISKYSQVQASI